MVVLARAVRLCIIAILLRSPVAAQHPGVLAGRVVDDAAASPVAGALVTIIAAARSTATDGGGSFALRGIEAGTWSVRVSRQGYADTTLVATVAHGRTTTLLIALRPRPERLAALLVDAARGAASGTRIDRAGIERSGARTAGDALQGVAGVVVRSTGPGSAQTVSIRGSTADAVLVLVDGVALNDPVTGEADLSSLPASRIASLLVLPGARSARFGPGAEAGVIVIETRRAATTTTAELSVGSLGGRGARAELGRELPVAWIAGASWHDAENAYDYASPPEAGGGVGRRANADASTLAGFVALRAPIAGGDLQTRIGAERLERGLPGRGFAPSLHARESVARLRGSIGWRRDAVASTTTLLVAGTVQRARFRDTAPPFGVPYDDTTRLGALEARLDAERTLGGFVLGGGIDTRWQLVDATALLDDLPARLDAGAFAHAATSANVGGATLTLSASARIDRDARAAKWFGSHSVAVAFAHGAVALQLANRSSYSPPTLGDQFFRESVGVEPNPTLRPERVPSETELTLDAHTRIARAELRATASLYQGHTRDMIVWAPDYRFVWRPSNIDVRRRGGELSAELRLPVALRVLEASYGYARVVYAAADDGAQLAYRPRHTGHVAARFERGAWSAGVETRYTGVRYPAAARVNALDAFWTTALDVARSWTIGDWQLRTGVHLDRVLDEDDTLIFGFPEPGRVAQLRVQLSRSNSPDTEHDR